MNEFNNGFALLIGVNDQTDPNIAKLPAVSRDIEAIQAFMTDPELGAYPVSNVISLTGSTGNTAPSRDNILRTLEQMKEAKEAAIAGTSKGIDPPRGGGASPTGPKPIDLARGTLLVVYYSGHGVNFETENGPEFCLVPFDTDKDKLADSLIPFSTLVEKLEEIDPAQLLLILDSCHAGGSGDRNILFGTHETLAANPADLANVTSKGIDPPRGGGASPTGPKPLGDRARVAILASSKGEELSYLMPDGSMSVFTHHLLEALTGAANPREGDTEVLVTDVMSYVSRHVPVTAERQGNQHPTFLLKGDAFGVAKLLGGQAFQKLPHQLRNGSEDYLERIRKNGGRLEQFGAVISDKLMTTQGFQPKPDPNTRGIKDILKANFIAADESDIPGGSSHSQNVRNIPTALNTTADSARGRMEEAGFTLKAFDPEPKSGGNAHIRMVDDLVRLWSGEPARRHTILNGDVGTGKTGTMLWIWQYLLASSASKKFQEQLPVPIYLSAEDYNLAARQMPNEDHLILHLIGKHYLGIGRLSEQSKSQLKALFEISAADTQNGSLPLVFLMIDGLHELEKEFQAKLRTELMSFWCNDDVVGNVQVMASTGVPTSELAFTNGQANSNFMDEWPNLTLNDLRHEQIHEYLNEVQVIPPNSTNLQVLLRNSMMLNMYVSTQSQMRLPHEESLFAFKSQIERPGELIWNFVESKLALAWRQQHHDSAQYAFRHFLLKYILPYIAYEMELDESNNGLSISRKQLRKVINQAFDEYSHKDFFEFHHIREGILEYRRYLDQFHLGRRKFPENIARVEMLMDELNTSLFPFQQEGDFFRFSNRTFLHFFCSGPHSERPAVFLGA
ncbi:MAG: caspase family protein [Bacteroidota bacterium]